MSRYEELGREIYGYYTRNGFGKVLKAEVDQAAFHCFLLDNVHPRYVSDGKIKYFHINKTEIYALSLKALLSESRIKNLLETDYFHYGKETKIEDFLLEAVNSTTTKPELLKAGKIQFLLPNPIARKYVEERIFSIGGTSDYSFNRDILVLDVYDFLRIVQLGNDDGIWTTTRENILAKSKRTEQDPEMKSFFDELNKVPIQERLKKIAQGAARKFVGDAGDEIFGAIVDMAKTLGRKAS